MYTGGNFMLIYDLVFLGICGAHVAAMLTMLVIATPGPKQ